MARHLIPIAVLRNAAPWAYIAGWFEIFMHGLVPGITYEYDIRSAYPYIIATLPCLLHGRWRRHKGPNPPALRQSQIRLVRTTPGGVRGSNPYIGAMLHRRRDGSIVRPHRTGGW